MGLTRVRLGDVISPIDERNANLIKKVCGIDKTKAFVPTKANTSNIELTKYKVVRLGRFGFSGMQTGRDKCIRVAMSRERAPFVISPAYATFEVTNDSIDPTYLFMHFLSPEMDRKGWFYSDGSIRANLDWSVFCDIEIELPPIDLQRKYVAIYESMLANQHAYESGLGDLFTTWLSTAEHLKNCYPKQPIGNFITAFNEKNSDGAITLEQGVNIQHRFITPQRSNSNLTGRKIVKHGQFAYCTQLNNENIAIAYRTGQTCVVSSVYDVFEITEKKKLLPGYLMPWLIRPEFGRYVYWASEGSAYEFLSYDNLSNYEIPVPPLDIQHSIASMYGAYLSRKDINERLKAQLKDICPILIRGSIEEAAR